MTGTQSVTGGQPPRPRRASGTRSDGSDYHQFIAPRLDSLRRVAYVLSRDWYRADDIVSDCVVKARRTWPRSDTMEDPDAYLHRILINTWLDRRRWFLRRRERPAATPLDTVHTGHQRHTDEQTTVLTHLAELPKRRRAMVVLRFYCAMSVEQTARILGSSTATIKNQTDRALDVLPTAAVNIPGVHTNLADAIDIEIGTLPPPTFGLPALIRRGSERARARARWISFATGAAVGAALVASFVLFTGSPHRSGAEPTATTPQVAPSTPAHPAPYTPDPLPTRAWPPLPLPTGVSPSLDATLARIGPSLGVPAGTRFTYIDLGGNYKGVDATWGKQGDPPRVWGNVIIDSAATVSKEIYSCAILINCVEVTGADGSMTYVAGPIVAPEPSATPTFGGPNGTLDPRLLPGHGHYAPRDFVYSYHPDGTFVMITISPEIEPATLTIAQLVAAGQAFSAVS